MKKLITLLIGSSLAFATVAPAKPTAQENPKNKKSQPAQQKAAPKQQMAPKHQSAPKHQTAPNLQVQATPKPQYDHPLPKPIRVTETKQEKHQGPKNEPAQQRYTDVPPVHPSKHAVKPNKHVVVQPNTLPAVQSNRVKANKTVKNYRPRHQNFHARVNPSVASVQFNQNFRIRNANNWSGSHYNVFRTYRPQWHDRSWWHSNHNHIILIGGGWYYWNSGYWYPAWGYDSSAAYYPYDGPIYVGSSPRPFDQVVADVQSILQEQGYYRGEVDGLVGPLTQEALAAYQSNQGLAPTAAIDQPTLESLGIS